MRARDYSRIPRSFRRGVLLLALSISTGFAAADDMLVLKYQGVERNVLVHVPPDMPSGQAAPLLILLHGGGGSARGMRRVSGMAGIADREGFIIAWPQAFDGHWNDGRETTENGSDDLGFIDTLGTELARRYPVDPGKIHLAGVSNGGLMSQRVACEGAGRFASYAVVIATMASATARECNPVRPRPVLMVTGTEDPLMPWGGGEVRKGKRRGKGGEVQGAMDTLHRWAALAGCADRPVVEPVPERFPEDGVRVERVRFADCDQGARVEMLKVIGGGHQWYGGRSGRWLQKFLGRNTREIDAGEVIWRFASGEDDPE